LAAARTLVVDINATQEAVSDAATDLSAAIDDLELATPVDATQLEGQLADVATRDQTDYTATSWAAVQAAAAAASALLATDPLGASGQAAVDAAAQALSTALGTLVLRGDLTAATALNAAAAVLVASDYTPGTWQILQTALAAARQVIAKGDDAEATETAAATATLAAAINGLVRAIHTEALASLIDTVEDLDLESQARAYTEDSFAAFASALAAARAALATPASQAAVDQAAGDLADALAGLTPDSGAGALAGFLGALDAMHLVKAEYTPASWAPFAEAWESAEALLATDPPSTVADGAVAELNALLAALAPRANLAGIAGAIDAAGAIAAGASLYTPASWQTFTAALAVARTLAGNLDAAQADVDRATADLVDALAGLSPAVRHDELSGTVLIINALHLDRTAYTDTSWNLLQYALWQAEAVISSGAEATQADIDTTLGILRGAVVTLVPLAQTARLDALVSALDDLGLQASEYTAATWTPYAAASAHARSLTSSSPQTTIDAATVALRTAVLGLESTSGAQTLATVLTVTDAVPLVASQYTDATWQVYAAAVAAADAVRLSGSATPGAAAAAVATLRAAAAALVPAPQTDTLTGALVSTSGLNPALYTGESWTAFAHARIGALIQAATPTSQAAVDQAFAALQAATVGLVLQVRTAELASMLLTINALAPRQADYTPASWATFAAARTAARAALNELTSQTAIDQAAADLRAGLRALAAAPPVTPTDPPTDDPTDTPTETPTDDPTDTPTDDPTDDPTDTPTDDPSQTPSETSGDSPTDGPTVSGTPTPTDPPASPSAPASPAPNPSTQPSVGPVNAGVQAPVAIVRVKASQRTIRLARGKAATLSAFAYTATGASAKVAWKSSKPSVASVSAKGTITAKRTGKATITVAAGGKTATIAVTVVSAATAKAAGAAVTSVKVARAPKAMTVGQAAYLSASASPSSAVGAKITYSSSKPGVATVDKAGRVRAVTKGKTVISVKAGGKTAKVSITVR
jgi:hypothetical protein